MKKLDWKKIGIRIKNARSKKHITQDHLAEMINSDRAVIAKIENGNKGCSVEYLISVANALEVSADSLLIDHLRFSEKTPEEIAVHQILSDCESKESLLLIRTIGSLRSILKDFNIK